MPTKKVGPFFSSVFLTDFTSFLTIFFAITDDSDTTVVLLVSDSDPGDTVGYSSVIPHMSMGNVFTVVPVVSVLSVADH
jgi:hypothetical protein